MTPFKFFVLLLHTIQVKSAEKASTQFSSNIKCPVLDCSKSAISDLEPGTCFKHDSSVPTKKIVGKLCYDVVTADIT